ncbi:MAG: hypothetical protein EOO64_01230 [Massilia sp.]|nr:MAG: hypothetical protein EOO64_01230 [Massilia sp.]
MRKPFPHQRERFFSPSPFAAASEIPCIFSAAGCVDCCPMTPHTKLKVANGLMLLGALLVPIGFYRFLAMVSPAPQRMSSLGDGLLNLGGLIAFALVVGMTGFVWSLLVERRHPSVQVSGTFAIRITIFIVVFVPLVFGSF